jgi:Tol biopolymer transport system component
MAPTFSPDGKHLAMSIQRPDSTILDIWLYDLARETLSRMTFADADDDWPVWSPDGERIAFYSMRDGSNPNMYVRRADGSGEVERLLVSERPQLPLGFTPDGNTFIYFEDGDSKTDLWTLSLDEGAKPEPFLATPFDEHFAALSPDGKWLLYTSNESGREEIYLRPFPKAPGKWQVSTSGGQHALWSPDGKELFYRKDNDVIGVAVDLSAGAPVIGRPTVLFEFSMGGPINNREYDISPDGQRFVVVQDEFAGGQTKRSHLRFVFNWFTDLDSKVRRDKP